MDNLVVPDAIGVYTGWKALTLHADGTLSSPRVDLPWKPRQPTEARCYCNFQLLTAPVENHRCGIYVANLAEAERFGNQQTVLVKVALWGKIIKGTRGARGQYAYPFEIHCNRQYLYFAAHLAGQKYGIPVHRYTDDIPRDQRKTDSDQHGKKRNWLWTSLWALLVVLNIINVYKAFPDHLFPLAVAAFATIVSAMILANLIRNR